MRVLFLISGKNVPSSRFRVLNYLPFLQQAGISCTVLASYPEKYEHIPWLGYRLSYLLKRITRYLHYLYACLRPFDRSLSNGKSSTSPRTIWNFGS